MATSGPLRSPQREPIPIDARAADHLRYIRETMESAAEFTAVPGWGGVAMGVTALVAAFAASRQTTPRAWLAVWLIEAFVAVAIAAPAAATKAHRANSALFSGPGRKFVLSFAPPIVVGGLLTFALYRRLWGRTDRLWLVDRPALWRLTANRMAKSSTAQQERLQRFRERSAPLEAIRNPAREAVRADLDRLIHERIRLGIVSALAVNRST